MYGYILLSRRKNYASAWNDSCMNIRMYGRMEDVGMYKGMRLCMSVYIHRYMPKVTIKCLSIGTHRTYFFLAAAFFFVALLVVVAAAFLG